ncbi:MAG: hypothetical protein V2I56_23585 [Desulfobacteraceae bacterium]|jgi:hypothetical protein|nr:hypothetical protein [Desulfobacteraceae bacterium]
MNSRPFVSRKELFQQDDALSWLVPGNQKMKTLSPTAEWLPSQFDNLHLLIEEKGQRISGMVVEGSTSLQRKILSLLQLGVLKKYKSAF